MISIDEMIAKHINGNAARPRLAADWPSGKTFRKDEVWVINGTDIMPLLEVWIAKNRFPKWEKWSPDLKATFKLDMERKVDGCMRNGLPLRFA